MMRSARKSKKRYLWTGFNANLSAPSVSPSFTTIELLAPGQVSTIADVLVERVVGSVGVDNSAVGTRGAIGLYIMTFSTDLAELLVSAQAWDPLSTDVDAMQKRVLYYRALQLSTASGALSAQQIEIDTSVKRKLGGDEGLWLVMSRSAAGLDVNYTVSLRVLASVGRK